MNKRISLAVMMIVMYCLAAQAQVKYTVSLVGVGTSPSFSYEGEFQVVDPGIRFTGGYGYGAELELEFPMDSSRLSIPVSVGYRSSAITEYTDFPSNAAQRNYRSHHLIARPAVRYNAWKFLSIDAGFSISYALTDPSETILEDYRGLTGEEQQIQPSFSDPIGVGGVYLNDYEVNYGPSLSVSAQYGKWSAFVRYDHLLATVGVRELREINRGEFSTTMLQRTSVKLKEWSLGVGLKL